MFLKPRVRTDAAAGSRGLLSPRPAASGWSGPRTPGPAAASASLDGPPRPEGSRGASPPRAFPLGPQHSQAGCRPAPAR